MGLYLKPLETGPMPNLLTSSVPRATQKKRQLLIRPGWNVPAILKQLEPDGIQTHTLFYSHGHMISQWMVRIFFNQDRRHGCEAICGAQRVHSPRELGGLVIPRSNLQKPRGTSVFVGKIDVQFLHRRAIRQDPNAS